MVTRLTMVIIIYENSEPLCCMPETNITLSIIIELKKIPVNSTRQKYISLSYSRSPAAGSGKLAWCTSARNPASF